jgi:hypothetical protein
MLSNSPSKSGSIEAFTRLITFYSSNLTNKPICLLRCTTYRKGSIASLSLSVPLSNKALGPQKTESSSRASSDYASSEPIQVHNEDSVSAPVTTKQGNTKTNPPQSYAEYLQQAMYKGKLDLHCRKSTSFGRATPGLAFICLPDFHNIIIILWKSGLLPSEDMKNTTVLNRSFNQLWTDYNLSYTINFANLRNPSIPRTSLSNAFTALAIAADLCIPSMIGFLQGEYTGEYRNREKIFSILRGHDCPSSLLNDLIRVYSVGAPAKFVAVSTRDNFQSFHAYGNHKSATSKPSELQSTIKTEVDLSYVIPLPSYLAPFIQNLHLSPLGLLAREGKPSRLIIDHSFRPDETCTSTNGMHGITDETPLAYGTTIKRHLQRIYNLRVSHPKEIIYLWCDDIASAFRHMKYNPFVAGAFCYVTPEGLYISTCQTFGSTTSPSNFEAAAQARAHLSTAFSNPSFNHLLEKRATYLKLMKWAGPEITSTSAISATCIQDHINPGVFMDGVEINTSHFTYVDDTLIADTGNRIPQAVAASTESCFIMFGEPDESIRPSSLSIKKFTKQECSPIRIQLGIRIDTNAMTIGIPKEKFIKLQNLVAEFPPHREKFSIIQGAELLGNLEHIGSFIPWFRQVYINIRRTFNNAIRDRLDKLRRTDEYNKLRNSIDSSDEDASRIASNKLIKLQTKYIYATTNKRDEAYLTPAFKEDLALIRALSEYRNLWVTPIPHIVDRVHPFTAFCDSSSHGAGGYSPELGFIWHIFWPKQYNNDDLLDIEDTHINIKEFLSIIITFALARQHLKGNPTLARDTYPTILIHSDNTSAIAWTQKGISSSNKIALHVARILCSLRLNSNLGLHVAHVPGEDNIISDEISRIPVNSRRSRLSSSPYIPEQVKQVRQRHSCIQHCVLSPIPSNLLLLITTLLSPQVGRLRINWKNNGGQLIPALPSSENGLHLLD